MIVRERFDGHRTVPGSRAVLLPRSRQRPKPLARYAQAPVLLRFKILTDVGGRDKVDGLGALLDKSVEVQTHLVLG